MLWPMIIMMAGVPCHAASNGYTVLSEQPHTPLVQPAGGTPSLSQRLRESTEGQQDLVLASVVPHLMASRALVCTVAFSSCSSGSRRGMMPPSMKAFCAGSQAGEEGRVQQQDLRG